MGDATQRTYAQPMTSQGHAVSRFARAVKTGNPNIVVAAAAELPRLSLAGPCLAAGREALHALATHRRLVDLCRALNEWEPPEL